MGDIAIGASRGNGSDRIVGYASTADMWASGGSAGERRALVNGTDVIGIWRWSTVIGGGTWVPDGLLDLGVAGVGGDSFFGVGVDGWPSDNGGGGSLAYAWVGSGLQTSGNGDVNQKSWWEWNLFDQAVSWDAVRGIDISAHVIITGTVSRFTGPYPGEMRDNGVDRNNVLLRYLALTVPPAIQVAYVGVNNNANTGQQGSDYVVRSQYIQSATDSGVRSTVAVGTAATAPTTFSLSATDAQANHQAGDTFQRFGLGHSAPAGAVGAGAWTTILNSISITVLE